MNKYLLFFFLLIAAFSLRAQVPDFKLNKTFGTPIFNPNDVAVDGENFIYVLENQSINKLDPFGNLVKVINITGGNSGNIYDNGRSLALDKAGNMYVLNTFSSQILKFSPQGKLLLRFGSFGSAPGQFGHDGALSVDEAGNIYLSDKQNKRIQKFNQQGEFVFAYKVPDIPFAHTPVGVEVGKSGLVYILTEEQSVFKISPAGIATDTIRLTFPGQRPTIWMWPGFALDDSENIYLSAYHDGEGNKIHKFSSSGQYLQMIGEAVKIPRFMDGMEIGLAIGPNEEVYAVNSSEAGVSALQVFYPDGGLKKRIINQDWAVAITQDDRGNFYLAGTYPDNTIKRYNSFGFLVSQFGTRGKEAGQIWEPVALATDQAGNVYCLESESIGRWSRIQKFSATGESLARFENFGLAEGEERFFSDLALDSQGNMYVTHRYSGHIRKLSPSGAFLAKFFSMGTGNGQVYMPKALTVDARGNLYVADYNGDRVQKFSPSGTLLQEFMATTGRGDVVNISLASVAVDSAGNLFTWNGTGGFMRQYDGSGKLVREITESFGMLSMNRAGTKLLVLRENLVREYYSGEPPQENLVAGKTYQDANDNCTWDLGEKPLPGIMVMAEPGPYYAISDQQGNYVIPVDTGRFTIRTILPQQPGQSITPSCLTQGADQVNIPAYGSLTNGPQFGFRVGNSPLLQVEVSSTRRRRCFRNLTTVSFSNTGFATASGAKVAVQLPEHVVLISASRHYTRDSKGNYIFAVGDLEPGHRGLISIIDSVSCADPTIRGLTVCTKAAITPGNVYPAPAGWNKAEISVNGNITEDGQARFVIRNTGTGNMTDSLFLRLYQDEDLVLKTRYLLASKDSLVLRFPPAGRAVRVEADQPQGHPVKAIAGANVEKRLRMASAEPAPALMAYPPDDPEPEMSISCLPIIDSFDPNDKQVVPAGLISERFTPTNTPLRYAIRFQNTGTDMAYRVVVVDTLAHELDLATFQVGAASHPFQLAMSGKDRPVLTFTFDNIMLPDSTRDPVGSNGFIQFSIRPKRNLPEKTRISNYADIYFDYNEPVRTNTTVNRIFDMPLAVEKQLALEDIDARPEVTDVSPSQSRSGQTVTLRGRNFAPEPGMNHVTFKGVAAMVLNATSTTLTVVVPANAFSGKIKVVTPHGGAQSSGDYIIFQPPTITAVTAMEGVPGRTITITGTHFSPLARQDTVSFDGVAAKVLEAAEAFLKVEVPAGAVWGNIRVRTLGGEAESAEPFRVWYSPVITGFSPAKGKAGTQIVIVGHHFSEMVSRNQVQFENQFAHILSASPDRLVVTVPVDASSGKIKVQTPGGTGLSATAFTYIPAPVISAVHPAKASAGAVVTISGENFNADGQADTVWFNDKPAKVLQALAGSLQVQAPKGVTSGNITVGGAGGRAHLPGFEVPELAPEEAILVYPNPTGADITVNWFKSNFAMQSMQVYSSIGALVISKDLRNVQGDETSLPFSRLGPGIYSICFQTSQGLVMKRVMVY